MADLYEEWAAETLSYAKQQADPWWRDAFGEIASELLSLARVAREAGV